ncbi:MAG: LamG-like jellyroll fold domain-containing protein, partial [Roseibacillus sp.]
RPADGLSINIGNDLPDTIGLAEEGSGSGIRICFDTWDSGGGEAPAIDVWRGTEGEVGDGNQGGWSGGMLVRQKFNGVTTATEDEKFKDENGDYVWMWTQGEWVDVNIKFLNGMLTINYKGHEVIKHTLPAAWEPLVGPNWLFAARTGGANETHWIDDLSIKLYASTVPLVSGFDTNAVGFDIQVTDIEEAGVDPDTIKVTLDGEVVETAISKADGVTSIGYAAPEVFASGSDHTLNVKYTDTNGKAQLLNLDFTIDPYTTIDASAIADASLKGESGFLVYPTQISSGQGVGTVHGTVWAGAEKQFQGGFIDPDTEEQYLNEADIDSFEGWSYYPEIVETVNQNQDAPGGTGNFKANDKGNSTDREDEPLTGIPGWGDSTDGIATEYIALLDLAKGAYTLGVNSDDGFAATIAPDFRDKMAQLIGVYPGNRGAASTEFNIYVAESGLYPLRVFWWEGGAGASIEIYSLVNGEKTLINDPEVDGSIKAYTIKGATVDESTLDLAETGRAKITSARPSSGGSISSTGEYTFVIEGGSVNADSVALSIDGAAVNADVSKSGSKITVTYTPAEPAEPGSAHTATLSYDENGIVRTGYVDYTISLIPGGAIFIETEDFNYEGGGWMTFEETKLGGSYVGLGAEEGIDFHNSGNASPNYRDIGDNHPGMAANVDNDRGDFVVESGWKMGWNDNGDWYNYTRDFPEDAIYYDVVGRFSSGGAPVDNSLSIVSGDTLSEDQTTREVGVFRGPATACWDCFEFYPMTDKTGAAGAVKLGGKVTLRLTKVGGNMDTNYMMFIPSATQEYPPALVSTAPAGAASSADSIQVVLQKREIDLADPVLSVNGEVVGADISTDGDVITVTAKTNPSKFGMNDASFSFNGSSVDWSYFYYGDPLSEDGPNPIAFWDFNLDIGNGTTIDSVYGLVGQLRNGAAFTDDSHEGTAMDFTDGGNQHVHVAAGEFLNIASSVNQVTVAFWQKNYAIPSTSSFWAEPGRAMQAHVPWSNGEIYWDTAGCCNGGTQRINANATDFGGWGEDLLDTWHHYVFVKNEDLKEIWIDGELFHEGDNTSPLPSDIDYLNIGGDQNGNNSLRGVIDDFVVFASALDEDQIIALAEGDRSILPAAPGYPILVSARAGGLPGMGSYYVQTVGAVPGPWAFKDGVWVSDGSVAGCGGPYHDFLSSPDYVVTAAGDVTVSVDHRHAFEGAMWDAGQLWISVNGGAYADVGKDAFTANGYTDVAIIGNGIAKGQNGFGNTSAGHADGSYITTTASLGSFAAGDAISVRFVALYDDCATGA